MMLVRLLYRPETMADLDWLRVVPWRRVALGLLVAWFLRCWLAVIPAPLTFPDSVAYLHMPTSFWDGLHRPQVPPVVPGFYWLLGNDQPLIVLAQYLLSAVGWLLLAWAVARLVQPSWLAFAAVLLCGLYDPIRPYHCMMLTESLTGSLLIASAALTLLLCRERSAWLIAALGLAVCLLVLCRDTNAYLVLLLAPLALLLRPWRYTLVLIPILLTAGYSLHSADTEQRHLFPLWNNIAQRVLPYPERVREFQAMGMPVNPSLLNRAGTWASSDDLYFYKSPDIIKTRQWVEAHGKQAWMRWLIKHPAQTLTTPWNDTLSPLSSPWAKRGLIVLALGLALVLYTRRADLLVMLALLASAYPMLALCYWGDAMEVPRHSVGVLSQLQLASVAIAILGLLGHGNIERQDTH